MDETWWAITFIGFALLLGLGSLYACRVAYRSGWARGVEWGEERMRLIDPPNRRPGLPTNLGEPPSDVRKPRIVRSHFMR